MKKISTTVYLDRNQVEELKRLHDESHIPMAEFIRRGVDLVIEHYHQRRQAGLPGLEARLKRTNIHD